MRYSSVTPASWQRLRVAASQMEDWTSPMCALPSKSIHMRLLANAPADGQGSSPSSSMRWKGATAAHRQPASVSWRSSDSLSTRIPMELSSMAWSSSGL